MAEREVSKEMKAAKMGYERCLSEKSRLIVNLFGAMSSQDKRIGGKSV